MILFLVYRKSNLYLTIFQMVMSFMLLQTLDLTKKMLLLEKQHYTKRPTK